MWTLYKDILIDHMDLFIYPLPYGPKLYNIGLMDWFANYKVLLIDLMDTTYMP
jgi:hypothetical protein